MFIRRKYGHKQLSQATYLSEAEPFLEQYAKRSPVNQTLIGSAGNLVRVEDFLAIVEGGMDEEGDLQMEREVAPSSPGPSVNDTIPKKEGLIVFFPGKEIWNRPRLLSLSLLLSCCALLMLGFHSLVNLVQQNLKSYFVGCGIVY